MGGEIKINDIIYGTSFASGITCDDEITVQEKLSNAAYLSTDEEIEDIPQGNYLYTTDMIDNVKYAEFTNKCYRKNNEDKVLDGNDYNSLNERLETVRSAIDKLNTNLGGFSFYNNPTVIYLVSDGSIYVDANDNYILADSVTGEILLMDTATYTTNIVEGNFYRIKGADSVSPFKKDSSEKYKHMIIDSLQNTKLELTYDSTWEEIATGLNELFP